MRSKWLRKEETPERPCPRFLRGKAVGMSVIPDGPDLVAAAVSCSSSVT